MLTVKQAAERLRVSAALVYALCAQGRIAHERYGLGRGTIRISEDALRAYQELARVERPCSVLAQLKHITMSAAGSP